MYEAVQQDKPVVPMKVNLGSDQSTQNGTEMALMNPYSAALHKNFDSEFQEEPLAALNKADLSWSILMTRAVYYSSSIFIHVSSP